jgi:hypothetical protein
MLEDRRNALKLGQAMFGSDKSDHPDCSKCGHPEKAHRDSAIGMCCNMCGCPEYVPNLIK